MEIDQSLITYRTFKNVEVPIMKIKKGSLFFRLIYDTPSKNIYHNISAIETFLGRKVNDTTFCLTPNHNVFFYTFPYVMDTNYYLFMDNVRKGKMMVCKATKDLNVALFLSPSNFERVNKKQSNEFVITCDNFEGHASDPCFREEFMVNNTDVVGMYTLQRSDVRNFKNIAKKSFFKPFEKFIYYYRDVQYTIGPPELILYPLQRRSMNTICTELSMDVDIYDYIRKNQEMYNYEVIEVFDHKFFQKDKLYSFMNQNFNKFNFRSGFYEF